VPLAIAPGAWSEIAMNPMLGILLKLGAVIAFVVMQALIKGTEGPGWGGKPPTR